MKPYPIVLIEWVDSAGYHRWESESEAKARALRFARNVSVGFLISKDREHVAIVQSIDPPREDEVEANMMHCLTIPRVAVTKITTLERRPASRGPRP